jgi:hypothetical protein
MNKILCCNLAMEKVESGKVVFEMAGDRVYRIWFADIFVCKLCGNNIISDFGDNPIYGWHDNFTTIIEKHSDIAYKWYEKSNARYVVCKDISGYKMSLTINNVYLDVTTEEDVIKSNNQLIRVVDNTNEDYLYPRENFEKLC